MRRGRQVENGGFLEFFLSTNDKREFVTWEEDLEDKSFSTILLSPLWYQPVMRLHQPESPPLRRNWLAKFIPQDLAANVLSLAGAARVLPGSLTVRPRCRRAVHTASLVPYNVQHSLPTNGAQPSPRPANNNTCAVEVTSLCIVLISVFYCLHCLHGVHAINTKNDTPLSEVTLPTCRLRRHSSLTAAVRVCDGCSRYCVYGPRVLHTARGPRTACTLTMVAASVVHAGTHLRTCRHVVQASQLVLLFKHLSAFVQARPLRYGRINGPVDTTQG